MNDPPADVNHPQLVPVGEDDGRRGRIHALAGELVRLELVARLAVAFVPHPAHLSIIEHAS